MRTLFIEGSNQYGVVSHFLRGMKDDLKGLGVEVETLDLGTEEGKGSAMKYLGDMARYNFIVSFNTLGLDLQEVLEYAKTGNVFVYLVDHPLHLLKRYIGLKVKVLCVDKEHVSFCSMCNIEAVYFPHGLSHQEVTETQVTPYGQKNAEVVFPASFFDLDKAREKLTPVWHEIELHLNRSSNITEFWQHLGVLPGPNKPVTVQLNENVLRISILVDFYLRARNRQRFLRDFASKGLELTVIGNKSQHYQSAYPQHKYEPAVSYHELMQRVNNARFLAHNSPGFEHGLHERVVMPLCQGTKVISSVAFIKDSFPTGVLALEDVTTHSSSQYDLDIAGARRKLAESHTWQAQWQPLISGL